MFKNLWEGLVDRMRYPLLLLLLLLLSACEPVTAGPFCGWQYTAWRWDSLATSTWRLVVTDSVWVCSG